MTTELLERPDTTKGVEILESSRDGKEYELIKGELIEMPGPSYSHGEIVANITAELRDYNKKAQKGGVVTSSAFVLDKDNAPRPDVAFVSNARREGVNRNDAFPSAPDLAVEVVSRTDILFDVDDKVDLYLGFGTALVWVVNPNKQLIFVYRPGANKPTMLGVEDELDGEGVIEGFKLPVRVIFQSQV